MRPKAPIIKSVARSSKGRKRRDEDNNNNRTNNNELFDSSPNPISWARPVMDVRQKSLLGTKPMPILECSFYKKLHPEEEKVNDDDCNDNDTTPDLPPVSSSSTALRLR